MHYSQWTERYSVIFLLDRLVPKKILLLKRAAWKKFAPQLYTGIGGSMKRGEAPATGAVRELEEEVGIREKNLTEFARCIIGEPRKLLHYYGLVYDASHVPACTEGTLEWVPVEYVLDKDIIPTTRFVIEAWKKRAFRTTKPFTVYLHEIPAKNELLRTVDRVEEGLNPV